MMIKIISYNKNNKINKIKSLFEYIKKICKIYSSINAFLIK